MLALKSKHTMSPSRPASPGGHRRASVGPVSVTPLTSAAEVLVATGHDPFARSCLRSPAARGWCDDGVTAWMGVDQHEHALYLNALGSPAAAGALVGELAGELAPGQRVTLPRGTTARLPAWVGLDGTDWDFRWLAAPPAEQPGEDRVVVLDDDAPAITALLARASPTASALPGDATVWSWVGVRSADGALLACAADTSSATGVGHLSSIAVDPAARGQGLGRAVTAALVRRQLTTGCDLVTLGVYTSNAPGRALYDALGFADSHRFTSGQLQVRGRW